MKHVVYALCATALLAWGCGDDNPTDSSQDSRTIVDGTMTVAAGVYREYVFNVGDDLQNVSVRGEFRVTSGSETTDTINVAILSETNYTNWVAGNPFSVLYGSGEIQSDEFTGLGISEPGNYYLVFSNVTGTTQKTVDASFELRYTPEE